MIDLLGLWIYTMSWRTHPIRFNCFPTEGADNIFTCPPGVVEISFNDFAWFAVSIAQSTIIFFGWWSQYTVTADFLYNKKGKVIISISASYLLQKGYSLKKGMLICLEPDCTGITHVTGMFLHDRLFNVSAIQTEGKKRKEKIHRAIFPKWYLQYLIYKYQLRKHSCKNSRQNHLLVLESQINPHYTTWANNLNVLNSAKWDSAISCLSTK